MAAVTLEVCPDPIFILGSPRSGTTALAAALETHTALWTSSESQILWDLFCKEELKENYRRAARPDGSWLLSQGISPPQFLRFIGLGLNALFTDCAGGSRWVDHTPVYTFIVDDIAAMFPGAVFIHILRDGRRVVESMTHFPPGLGTIEPWSTSFHEASRAWARFTRAASEFTQKNPERCLTVRNEELSADPTNGFRRIQRFLGLKEEEGPAQQFSSCRVNSSFPEPASGAARQPPPWHEWDAEKRSTFATEAGPLMVQLGLASADEFGG